MVKGFWQCMAAGALWFGVAVSGSAAATDIHEPESDWQEHRLMNPSDSQRQQEKRGTVFIYDGLENNTVAQAMDQHFDRIQNMMFTRIHHRPATAADPVVVENDGCE